MSSITFGHVIKLPGWSSGMILALGNSPKCERPRVRIAVRAFYFVFVFFDLS